MLFNFGELIISVTIPHRLMSEANNGDNIWKKRKRKLDHLRLVNSFLNRACIDKVILPCAVKLTRISTRGLDYDNLVYAFKPIRDCVADKIIPGLAPGRADDDKRISWVYDQEKGKPKEYAYRIDIYKIATSFPS